jgi:single-strand DNA-binding protein
VLNRIILIGRLTKDPELRYTPNGTGNCTFALAVERQFKNAQGQKEADFLNIVCWRQLAETCANYLARGRLCAVEGRVQVRHYDNNEGKRVYMTEVIADNVRFLESKNQRDAEETGSRSTQSQDPFSDDGKPIDIGDDDLPF